MKRTHVILIAAAVLAAVIVASAASFLLPRSPANGLPPGCIKPAGGFLILASNLGFNDSINHAGLTAPWPVITVHQGQSVSIVVCNTDIGAHGFQVTHYFESTIESIAPGQIVHISFTADQQGNFTMYCSIFCSIHSFMQNGLLRVTA